MSALNKEVVVLEGTIKHDTGKALLFSIDNQKGREESYWFPLSQIESIHRNPTGLDKIAVARWLAVKKGLV